MLSLVGSGVIAGFGTSGSRLMRGDDRAGTGLGKEVKTS
jgi:hypothetical protein